MKKAVLFAVPGTTTPGADAAYRNIERCAAARFPGVGVRWVFTSSVVRRKRAAAGRAALSPAQTLAAMRAEGFTHVVVQPLQFVAGAEFGEVAEGTRRFRSGVDAFERLLLGRPLLETAGQFARAAAVLLEDTPAADVGIDALVLAAHGSRQPAAADAFERAGAECTRLDKPVFVATLTSAPGIDDVAARCREAGVRKVCLVPFMVVGGRSARNEIGGPGPGSFRTRLERQGIACEPVLAGLGEYDRIADIWLDQVESLWRTVSEDET